MDYFQDHKPLLAMGLKLGVSYVMKAIWGGICKDVTTGMAPMNLRSHTMEDTWRVRACQANNWRYSRFVEAPQTLHYRLIFLN